MSGWLESIRMGDGELPLFGDAWHDETNLEALLAEARGITPAIPPREPERHGGLAGLDAGALRLVARVGAHGPDYMLGHAHADLLSFELADGARRIVTDTGTHTYDPGPDRQRLRSTAAHNTIQLGGHEQLETWGSFRVARRGSAHVAARGTAGAWQWLSAWHDAWSHLPGRPVHHRLFALAPGLALVLDHMEGSGETLLASRLHLHPHAVPDAPWIVPLSGTAADASAPLHERFGETRSMRALTVELPTRLPWSGGWWIDFRAETAALAPELHTAEAVLTLRPPTGDAPEVRWRPTARDPEAVFALSD
jgi:hypothetical protein